MENNKNNPENIKKNKCIFSNKLSRISINLRRIILSYVPLQHIINSIIFIDKQTQAVVKSQKIINLIFQNYEKFISNIAFQKESLTALKLNIRSLLKQKNTNNSLIDSSNDVYQIAAYFLHKKFNPSPVNLNFRSSYLNFKILSRYFLLNSGLIELNLADNNIGLRQNDLHILLLALGENCFLTQLNLANNNLGESVENIRILSLGLAEIRSLKALNLSENSLAKYEISMKYFCQFMQNKSMLKSLNLAGNNYIGSNELNCQLFCEAIAENKFLNNLNLGRNELAKYEKNIFYLCQALQRNDCITHLYLTENSLGQNPSNAEYFKRALETNMSLNTVSLSYNKFGIFQAEMIKSSNSKIKIII